jgi:hypothetical protein
MATRAARLTRLGRAAAALTLSLVMAACAESRQVPPPEPRPTPTKFSFAVIGDIPYGSRQRAAFPRAVEQINADRAVQLVYHLGDMKDGSTRCSTDYYRTVKRQFDRFDDPLIYTPGDNEWTDCHEPDNGSYNPLDRLQALRRIFYPKPGRTLGQHSIRVTTSAAARYPENVRYNSANVSFATVHLVGDHNGLGPWTGRTMPTPEQTAEVAARTRSAVTLIHDTFADATERDSGSIVLLTQADMFGAPSQRMDPALRAAYGDVVAAIASGARDFDGWVYLINGDSHIYRVGNPLQPGSRWLGFYRLPRPVYNLTRVTIDGAQNADNYLKATIDLYDPESLSFKRVPFAR